MIEEDDVDSDELEDEEEDDEDIIVDVVEVLGERSASNAVGINDIAVAINEEDRNLLIY